MELKVKPATDESGQIIEANYIISEIIDGFDALDNPIKMLGESGQYTRQSIIDNILTRTNQIEAIEKEIEKWQIYLDEVENFLLTD